MGNNNIDLAAWAHVYGQHFYHSPATIRGNREALRLIRDAIDHALEAGEGEAKLFAGDGEGYGLHVIRVNTMATLGSPEYLYQLEYDLSFKEGCRRRKLKLPKGPDEW